MQSLYIYTILLLVLYTLATNVVTITEGNFDDLIVPDKTWLVAVTAPWCSICTQMKPEFTRAAGAQKGKVHVGQIDSTISPRLTQRFHITGYPTIFQFKNGQYTRFNAGALQESQFYLFATHPEDITEWRGIPDQPSIWASFVHELNIAINDISIYVSNRPDISTIIFACGLLSGVLLSIGATQCCIDKRVQQRVKAKKD